jgi:hypothetical protein
MLRTITGRLSAAIAVLTVLATSATARTVAYSGPCEGGGNWLVVLTIGDNTGRVTGREGVNCLGQHWRDECKTHLVSPVGLPTFSDHLYLSETSSAWVRWNRDAAGHIIRMWGMTAAGSYWEADGNQQFLQ